MTGFFALALIASPLALAAMLALAATGWRFLSSVIRPLSSECETPDCCLIAQDGEGRRWCAECRRRLA